MSGMSSAIGFSVLVLVAGGFGLAAGYVVLILGGGGHGTVLPAILLFPYSTLIGSLIGDKPLILVIGAVQYPAYVVATSLGVRAGSTVRRQIRWLALTHGATGLASLVVMIYWS